VTALAQGTAGAALVMSFALLCVQQIRAASILLAVQSAAAAVAAVVLRQPLLAIAPVLLAAGTWFAPRFLDALKPRTVPTGGAKWAVGAGATLAVLCQSQAGLALPLTVILLSILLAATQRHPLMQVIALIGIQNGVVLAACLVNHLGVPPAMLLPVACFVLPLPLAAGLLVPMRTRRNEKTAAWIAWFDLTVSLGVFVSTLLVPLDSIASVFAPLLGLDGVLRSCGRRNRAAMSLTNRSLALLTGVLLVLAVCSPNPIIAWLAVFASTATALLPTLTRRWNAAMLAFLGAGIALFGLLLLTLAPSVPGYFSVFAGFTAIAAIVPDLAPVLVVLLLRLANQAPWPPAAESLGLAITLIALLVCATMVWGKSPLSSVTLLQQSHACIAALSVCLGQSDGRFAALVLLVLVILTRAAARVTDGLAASLAIAGLAGLPPLGVFPGLILVVLVLTGHDAWLLFPLGAACIPILLASLPRRLPTFRLKAAIPSVGWLPLALALFSGYFAPDGLVHWWHALTAGRG
jgi:hydrogenase-4 component E